MADVAVAVVTGADMSAVVIGASAVAAVTVAAVTVAAVTVAGAARRRRLGGGTGAGTPAGSVYR